MSNIAGQSTDAANSAAMIGSTRRDDDCKKSSRGSLQKIAGEDGAATGGDGNDGPVTAPFPSGDQ